MKKIESKDFSLAFGKFITDGRLKKEMFQKDVAEKLEISQSYYSYIEVGKRQIDLALAMKICDVLDLDLRKFITQYM